MPPGKVGDLRKRGLNRARSSCGQVGIRWGVESVGFMLESSEVGEEEKNDKRCLLR